MVMPGTQISHTPVFSLILTGGIGSGKSTVAQLFAQHGAGVVDTDDIAHQLTTPHGKAMDAIRQVFGDDFINDDGSMNRTLMRELVFQDALAKKRLENILHPLIRQEALIQAATLDCDYVIYVIPLLTEQPVWQGMGSHVLLVDCPEELQIQRVMARSPLSREQILSIMATQASREERWAIADDVILNDNGIDVLNAEVARLHAEYKKIAEKMAS